VLWRLSGAGMITRKNEFSKPRRWSIWTTESMQRGCTL